MKKTDNKQDIQVSNLISILFLTRYEFITRNIVQMIHHLLF